MLLSATAFCKNGCSEVASAAAATAAMEAQALVAPRYTVLPSSGDRKYCRFSDAMPAAPAPVAEVTDKTGARIFAGRKAVAAQPIVQQREIAVVIFIAFA